MVVGRRGLAVAAVPAGWGAPGVLKKERILFTLNEKNHIGFRTAAAYH